MGAGVYGGVEGEPTSLFLDSSRALPIADAGRRFQPHARCRLAPRTDIPPVFIMQRSLDDD